MLRTASWSFQWFLEASIVIAISDGHILKRVPWPRDKPVIFLVFVYFLSQAAPWTTRLQIINNILVFMIVIMSKQITSPVKMLTQKL